MFLTDINRYMNHLVQNGEILLIYFDPISEDTDGERF